MPAMRRMFLAFARKTSRIGAWASVWVSLTSSNTGDSAILSLIKSPTSTTTALSRNGMRQPQARNCSSGRLEKMANTPAESSVPAQRPTGPLPSYGETLYASQQDEQDRCEYPHRVIRRKAADENGSSTHHQQRDD